MNVRRVAWQRFARLRAVGQAAQALAILSCAFVMPLNGVTTAAVAQEARPKIAFVGDSTSDGLWGGFSALAPRNSCLKGTVDLGRFAKNSTGLTRPERYSWPDEVKRIGDSYKPTLFVMSLGLNDRQSVVYGGKVTLDNSPDYPARYKERVTAVLKSAAASRTGLLWIGLPAMRDAAADRDARLKNTFFAEAIAEFGDPTFQYVPPWRLNSSGEDKFASFGPDQNGKIIQIRASDGEHFTPAGDMLVAAYLLPKITAILLSRGAKLGDACAS